MSFAYSEVLQVRYRDTDAQGHLYFANYQVFADEVCGAYMKTLGFDASRPEQAPCYVFTASIRCDYLSECVAGDAVRVAVGYTRLGNTSADLGFALYRLRGEHQEEPLARGAITQVFVDKASRRPMPIPEALRARMLPDAGAD